MGLANLARNRKRTMLVIVSMTLSLVLFNIIFTLSSGFDIDKYIAKFMDTDFMVSTASYFQFQFEKSESIHAMQCRQVIWLFHIWHTAPHPIAFSYAAFPVQKTAPVSRSCLFGRFSV